MQAERKLRAEVTYRRYKLKTEKDSWLKGLTVFSEEPIDLKDNVNNLITKFHPIPNKDQKNAIQYKRS